MLAKPFLCPETSNVLDFPLSVALSSSSLSSTSASSSPSPQEPSLAEDSFTVSVRSRLLDGKDFSFSFLARGSPEPTLSSAAESTLPLVSAALSGGFEAAVPDLFPFASTPETLELPPFEFGERWTLSLCIVPESTDTLCWTGELRTGERWMWTGQL